MFCCYIAAYLDRVNIGFAKLQILRATPSRGSCRSAACWLLTIPGRIVNR